MNDALKTVVTRTGYAETPQNKKALAGQVLNNDLGYVFTISEFDRIKRFLILGSDSTYYQSGSDLSKENADVIIKAAETSDESSKALVDLIVQISTEGRAPKQNPGLFALAIASSFGSSESKQYALSKLSSVARTGTTLFQFVGYVTQFRGWGRSLKTGIAMWYRSKPVDKLAYQIVKYKQREGFTHRDLFRLSHPKGVNQDVGNYILNNTTGEGIELPTVIVGHEKAKVAKTTAEVVSLIKEYNLSWEMIPTEYLNEVKVWETLLDNGNVPLGALLRQLPRLTTLGVVKPLGKYTKVISGRFNDPEELSSSRIHPMTILVAMKTYASGYSLQGSSTWKPVAAIVDALDSAFYKAFKNVEPSNKKTMIALDVSGSMSYYKCAGLPLTPCEAVTALSLVIANTEPETHIVGFSSTVEDLGISNRDSLGTAMLKSQMRNFGATNAAAAIQYATRNKLEVETFIIMTDNEVNQGSMHVAEALNEYRRKTGINAKLVVVATTATNFSVGDPNDAGTLNVAGFDSVTPQVISAFSSN